MKMKKLLTLLLAVLLLAGCAGNKPGTFEAGKNTFLLNGETVRGQKRQRCIIRVFPVNTGNIVLKCVKHWA